MRSTYVSLALIALVVSLVYLVGADQAEWIRDYAPGLATEVLGILLTLVFVQRILERRQLEDRARASRGGVRRSEAPIRDLAELMARMIRAAVPLKPARPPQTYEDLFASEWPAELDVFDVTRVRYPWSGETWAESAARVIARTRHQISGILDSYGVHLDTHLIEALDDLRDDEFLLFLETLGEQYRVERELHNEELDAAAFTLERTAAVRARALRTLSRCIDRYNRTGLGERRISELPGDFW